MAVLKATGLQKSYKRRMVVSDVSLEVGTGQIVGLLGPNGAGKTTSFYMIVGLVRADAGQITLDRQPVERLPIHRRARLGLLGAGRGGVAGLLHQHRLVLPECPGHGSRLRKSAPCAPS